MAYDKETKKTNRYTFRWSLGYFGGGIVYMLSCCVLCWIDGVSFIPIVLVSLYFFYRKGRGVIRYTTIEPDRITIVRIWGKIVLEGILSIEHVTEEELNESTSCELYNRRTKREETVHGITMRADKFSSTKYGEFTRICVNFKELAMVTCADGKKYLINYPKELFEQTSDIHVYKPELNRKWAIVHTLSLVSMTLSVLAFPGLFLFLVVGMFVEFFLSLLVCFFLLLSFGICWGATPIEHIRIGADWISILLSSPRKTIMLDNVESVQYVTKKELEVSTTYTRQLLRFQRPRTCHGLSMLAEEFTNYRYGKFTRICNNFDELAMVTLANGKKYLINYPKELLEKK